MYGGFHLTILHLTIFTSSKIKHASEIQHYIHDLYYPHIMSIENDEIRCISLYIKWLKIQWSEINGMHHKTTLKLHEI